MIPSLTDHGLFSPGSPEYVDESGKQIGSAQ